MKTAEIREISTKEIQERVEDSKLLLTRLKLNHAVSPLENPNQISKLKKDIARMKTEMRMRQINETKK